MNLPKPPKCAQDWLKMLPVEGGRICAKCDKKIHDFSNKSWQDIENIQRENNYQVCGTYTKRQLKNWGEEKAGNYISGHAILLSSLLFGTPLMSEKSLAASPVEYVDYESSSTAIDLPALNSTDSLPSLLKGKVIDAESGEGLPFVDVLIKVEDSTLVGTKSDFDGNYSIQLSEDMPRTGLTVQFNYIGYQSTTYKNVHFPENMTPDEAFFLNAKLSGGEGIVYSVEYPSKWRRFWWRVGSVFRKKSD